MDSYAIAHLTGIAAVAGLAASALIEALRPMNALPAAVAPQAPPQRRRRRRRRLPATATAS
ncbi:MAG TPA: hypothetical protein VHA57_05870 [Actinomycetota bacterium]|nr:hypothetical protein [Actinomycetota bacterium]